MKNIIFSRDLAALCVALLVSAHSRPASAQVTSEPLESTTVATPDYGQPMESDPAARPYEATSAPRKMNPWWIFLGADAGMSFYGTFSDITERGRSGIHLGVRGLLARYFNQWVIDGGLGWQFLQNSGTYPSGDKVKVTTRGGYLDLSGRYRFPRSNWQLGPELQYWLSTDNGLNPSVFDNTSNTSLWAGLQGVYEWPDDDHRMRVGARWLTDVTVPGRSAHVLQVFFQWGFSVFGATKQQPRSREQINESDLERAGSYQAPVDPLPIATPAPEATPADPLPIPTPAPTAVPIAKEKVMVTLDVDALPFETASARLPRYHMDRVREIGRFLGERKTAWKTITVSGHTDERGSNAYNDKLSKARAQTVRQLLGEGGAPVARIKAVGMGERKPRARGHNEKAWAQNRRVEMEFTGVKDIQVINRAFDQRGQETR